MFFSRQRTAIIFLPKTRALPNAYNLSGQMVYQSVINGNVEIRLNKGIYIVNVNNRSEKIIVK